MKGRVIPMWRVFRHANWKGTRGGGGGTSVIFIRERADLVLKPNPV